MNNCNFTGRLTTDPELSTTNGGVSVCSFSLAVKRPRVKDTTDFINFVVWRNSAEYLCKYGHKGDMVEIVGALSSRKWEDKDGNKRTNYEVIVDDLRINGSKPISHDGQAHQSDAAFVSFVNNAQASGVEFEEIVGDGDLPF